MKPLVKQVWDFTKEFVKHTAIDFAIVWDYRPNVLIWCAIFGLILFWM
jgi:hypothetical protein